MSERMVTPDRLRTIAGEWLSGNAQADVYAAANALEVLPLADKCESFAMAALRELHRAAKGFHAGLLQVEDGPEQAEVELLCAFVEAERILRGVAPPASQPCAGCAEWSRLTVDAEPQPCAGCAALREALAKLAALWDAGSAYEVEDMGNTQYASGLQQCADELRAALAQSQPNGVEP